LKTYIRELPEPLLCYEFYDEFLSIPQLSEGDGIKAAQSLITQLPPINAALLHSLFQLLTLLVQNHEKNRMNHTNVAIVFGLNCLRSRETNPMMMAIDSGKINKCFELLLKWYPTHLSYILAEVSTRVSVNASPRQPIVETVQSGFVNTNKVYAPPPSRDIDVVQKKQQQQQQPPLPSSSRRPLPPPPAEQQYPPQPSYNNQPIRPISGDQSVKQSNRNAHVNTQALGDVLSKGPPTRFGSMRGTVSQTRQSAQNAFDSPPPRQPQQYQPQQPQNVQRKMYPQVPVDDPFGDFEDNFEYQAPLTSKRNNSSNQNNWEY
jgi:hypothetical protein